MRRQWRPPDLVVAELTESVRKGEGVVFTSTPRGNHFLRKARIPEAPILHAPRYWMTKEHVRVRRTKDGWIEDPP